MNYLGVLQDQLVSKIPLYTNYFSDANVLNSISIDAPGSQTVITIKNHGLKINDNLIIRNVEYQNEVTEITGNIYTSEYPHGLVKDDTFTIDNVEYTVVQKIDNNNLELDSTTILSYIPNYTYFNGIYTVSTVTSLDSITCESQFDYIAGDGVNGDAVFYKNIRVSVNRVYDDGAPGGNRIVINPFLPSKANRSTHSNTDKDNDSTPYNAQKNLMIEDLDIYIIMDNKKENEDKTNIVNFYTFCKLGMERVINSCLLGDFSMSSNLSDDEEDGIFLSYNGSEFIDQENKSKVTFVMNYNYKKPLDDVYRFNPNSYPVIESTLELEKNK